MRHENTAACALLLGLLAASCATAPAATTSPAIARYSAQDPVGVYPDENYQSPEPRYERNVQFMLGLMPVEPSALDPADGMVSYGFSVDTYEKDDPFGLEVFMRRTSGSDTVGGAETIGGMTEVGFGFRRTMPVADGWLGYIGAGFALILIERDEITAGNFDANEDLLPGFYTHAGAYYQFQGGWHAGLDGRAMLAEDPEFSSGDSAGYIDLLGFVGVSF